jgi:hypothetical protein
MRATETSLSATNPIYDDNLGAHRAEQTGETVDPELASLAQSAGTTLVTMMTTEAWQRFRERITQLWRQIQPHRAETVAVELQSDREEALAAHIADDRVTLDELCAQWQGRVRRLLAARPDAAAELGRLLEEFGPRTGGAAGAVTTQYGTASGRARVYQAGRDQHIADR